MMHIELFYLQSWRLHCRTTTEHHDNSTLDSEQEAALNPHLRSHTDNNHSAGSNHTHDPNKYVIRFTHTYNKYHQEAWYRLSVLSL